MDCHKVLKLLTDSDQPVDNGMNDNRLREILNSVYSCIDQDILDEVLQKDIIKNNVDNIRWRYLYFLLYTINILCKHHLTNENSLITVEQLKIVQVAIGIATSIGILPQLTVCLTKKHFKTFNLKQDNNNILEKHKILTYTVNILLNCFDNSILRPAVIPQMDCLFASLLQLSHALLKKPTVQNTIPSTSNSEFTMTIELYTKLKEEQEIFKQKLNKLILNCPQSLLFKELMALMGIKNNPKWFQINIKKYLVDTIMMPNGITALTLAICNEVIDVGKCWDKLDISAQLIATSHGTNVENYYNSVCSQIINILTLKNNKQGIIIANCYIKALYDYKPEICINKIFHIVMEPLLIKDIIKKEDSSIIRTENEVSQCIENLSKLFITTDAEFKCLPSILLIPVALPLFYLYLKSYKSIYAYSNQVQQLLFKIFENELKREMIYSAFLNDGEAKSDEFGERLCFEFGENGSLQITAEPILIEQEAIVDCLYDLVAKDRQLSFDLFVYLLKILPKLNELTEEVQNGKLLETSVETMARIERQLSSMKLLTLLSASTEVQKEQVKNPKPLLDFIEFFFSKIALNPTSDNTLSYEQDISMLYTSLMLIKIILTDNSNTLKWETFQNFIARIKKQFNFMKMPEVIISIVGEIEIIIKKKGKKSYTRNYTDLSVDAKNKCEFNKALADLVDPLLPVRAHGIINLTKLIENRHPEVSLKKDFLLCIFQESLNHEDSFIYLAAINGICAMSTIYPEKVITILVKEFIGVPEHAKNRDLSSETRVKLGEILVKTTRALGEMTPAYKSLLVNGFLTGTRDPDPLVRSSSLSCLGEFCKIMGFRLGNLITEILYCIGCIIKTDKDDGCRRAGVLVATLLLRGLGKDTLIQLGENLVTLYRSLKHLRDNDKDPVLQLHAQLALEEFDDIVQQFLFVKPKLEKSIFLLPN